MNLKRDWNEDLGNGFGVMVVRTVLEVVVVVMAVRRWLGRYACALAWRERDNIEERMESV